MGPAGKRVHTRLRPPPSARLGLKTSERRGQKGKGKEGRNVKLNDGQDLSKTELSEQGGWSGVSHARMSRGCHLVGAADATCKGFLLEHPGGGLSHLQAPSEKTE